MTDSDVSEKIQEAILNYIKHPETDFAVMISGEWGSGKTYFWQNILEKRIRKEILKEYSSRRIIYISLYGVENIQDIDNYIGIKLLNLASIEKSFPLLNKSLETVFKALKPVDYLHIINLAPVKDEMLKLLREQNLKNNATNLILCFDDLERSKIDLETLLGHINQYVEHNHIKTIIICNESEIGQDEKDNNKDEKDNHKKKSITSTKKNS
ncbi:KAP P-loop domain protein [Gloeothece citriformis PCC 7424]|uniref:KAP P-loop domain protein n=1 Tax=Gloeothece citriformis (strain PCC 7424) TaxID=65393 RepID=B7KI89_GLOC7|nr:P-loop NTPase fold protein [Gloeothece citriformis]ACK73576.1 KAP P-loop domain protein [Gloeothece citriformis PCC 7424]